MCSNHPRTVKRVRKQIEEIYNRTQKEITHADVGMIKAIKRAGADEFNSFQECEAKERYLKLLNMPTPASNNAPKIQAHLENILKVFK